VTGPGRHGDTGDTNAGNAWRIWGFQHVADVAMSPPAVILHVVAISDISG